MGISLAFIFLVTPQWAAPEVWKPITFSEAQMFDMPAI